ncbi:MAG: TIGR00730 family Rossman fold protein [Gammaproteobacteria bacterium]
MSDESNSNKRPITPNINDSMLTRETWKIFQVMAELVEGFERLVHIRPSVSIFGSARIPDTHPYYKEAQEVAEKLSNAGYSVVTGGGPGIMEAGNRGAFKGKSFSVGLNIVLHHQEVTNKFQDISLRFRHFFTRKVMFVKYACAYLVMPGGFGTLDELAEILALIQTKKTKKIPVILVNETFWRPLIDWFQNTLVIEQLIDPEDMKLFTIANTSDEVLAQLNEFYKHHSPYPNEQEQDIMSKL